MAGRTPQDKIRCSFCNKTQDMVRKMISGQDGAYICDECISLCTEILEEEMEDDLVKLKAALEIVRSFARIERLRKKSRVLERRKDTPQAEIKQITDAIKIELKNITDFSNSNGFSERYGKNKAKGLGSLSGIMKEMSEKRYENGKQQQ